MKIILANERPISYNKFYSGMHWTRRQEYAERVHNLTHVEAYRQLGKIKLLDNPVEIAITAYFKGPIQDADNIACKLYIDGLKNFLLKDDNHLYVKSVTARSIKAKENRVEIEITEI